MGIRFFTPDHQKYAKEYFILWGLMVFIFALFYIQAYFFDSSSISLFNVIYLPNDDRWYLDFSETKFFLIIYFLQPLALLLHTKHYRINIKNRIGYALVLNTFNVLLIFTACLSSPKLNVFISDDLIVAHAIDAKYEDAINAINKKYDSEFDRNYIISQFKFKEDNSKAVNDSILNARQHILDHSNEYVKLKKYRLSLLASVTQKFRTKEFEDNNAKLVVKGLTLMMILYLIYYANRVYFRIEKEEGLKIK